MADALSFSVVTHFNNRCCQCSGLACKCQCPVIMLEVPILQTNHLAILLPVTVHSVLHHHSVFHYCLAFHYISNVLIHLIDFSPGKLSFFLVQGQVVYIAINTACVSNPISHVWIVFHPSADQSSLPKSNWVIRMYPVWTRWPDLHHCDPWYDLSSW